MDQEQDQARSALAEVDRRRGQAVQIALREGAPGWFLAVGAVVVLATMLATDLRSLHPEWDGWFTRWGVVLIGFTVLAGAALLVHRRAGLTAHRSTLSARMSALAAWFVAYYVLAMAIGMPMRYFEVPFDQTVSGVGAIGVLCAGRLLWTRLRPGRA